MMWINVYWLVEGLTDWKKNVVQIGKGICQLEEKCW